MSRLPEVSIVMPVYNAELHLAETVESVLAQTYPHWELVAVDDGSTDNSLRILEDYGRRDDRLRILSRPWTGIAGARNDGIAAARAGLIACLDNDDVMMPERIEQQVAFMHRYPDCVAVGGAALTIDPDGDPLIEVRSPTSSEQIEAELLAGRNPMIQSAVMLRRETVVSINGYREECNYAEDYDLFLRLSERGRLANLAQVLLKQRQHLSRASFSTYRRQNQVMRQALGEAYERRGLTGPPPPIPVAWHPNTWRGLHIRCCCDAWDGGHVQTARKHAQALFALNPLSPRAWDLLARTYIDKRIYGMIVLVKKCLRPLKKFRPSHAR